MVKLLLGWCKCEFEQTIEEHSVCSKTPVELTQIKQSGGLKGHKPWFRSSHGCLFHVIFLSASTLLRGLKAWLMKLDIAFDASLVPWLPQKCSRRRRLWGIDSWTTQFTFQAIQNPTFSFHTAWTCVYSRCSANYTARPCFHALFCSTWGPVSFQIYPPFSLLTYFCLSLQSLLSPPQALHWPSNPLQHLATGPLGTGQRVTVQANIRKHESVCVWEECGALFSRTIQELFCHRQWWTKRWENYIIWWWKAQIVQYLNC